MLASPILIIFPQTLWSINPLTVYEDVGAGIEKTVTVVFKLPYDISDGNYVLVFSGRTGKFGINASENPSQNTPEDIPGYH